MTGLKGLLMTLIIGASMLLTGCFSGDAHITINEDGSANIKTTLAGVPLLQPQIESAKNSILMDKPDAIVKPINNGGMVGYEILQQYERIADFAGHAQFAAHEGKNTGITIEEGWFYNVYDFDILFEGNATGTSQNEVAVAQALLSSVSFNYTITLPDTPHSHNAKIVSEDGKTLTWNLAQTLLGDGEEKIQVKFKLWNKAHIIVTTVGAVLVLIVIAWLMFARRKKHNDEVADEDEYEDEYEDDETAEPEASEPQVK